MIKYNMPMVWVKKIFWNVIKSISFFRLYTRGFSLYGLNNLIGIIVAKCLECQLDDRMVRWITALPYHAI